MMESFHGGNGKRYSGEGLQLVGPLSACCWAVYHGGTRTSSDRASHR